MRKIRYVNVSIPEHHLNLVRRILAHYESDDVRVLQQLDEIVHELDEVKMRIWNPDYDQSAKCACGHIYSRHFDGYDDMRGVGCKYCECFTFSTPAV